MLGTELLEEGLRRGLSVIGVDRSQFDIADPDHPGWRDEALAGANVVINAAAYTAVDRAESEPVEADRVNHLGAGRVARWARSLGARTIQVSTDYAFPGDTEGSYREEDPTEPRSVYGRTKRDGERAVLSADPNAIVARTSWLFGPAGACFPKTMARLWREGKTLRVVSDQVGRPTYAPELARAIFDLIRDEAPPGIVHLVGGETMSWFTFARLSLETLAEVTGEDRPIVIEPILTSDYPTPAERPKRSVLESTKRPLLERPLRDCLIEMWRKLELTAREP